MTYSDERLTPRDIGRSIGRTRVSFTRRVSSLKARWVAKKYAVTRKLDPQESSHFYTSLKTLVRNYQCKFVLLNLHPLEQSRSHRIIFFFLSSFFFSGKINSRPLSFGRFTSKLIRPRVSIAEHIGPQTIRPRRSGRECRSVSESDVSLSASCAASMRSQGPLVLPFFRSS